MDAGEDEPEPDRNELKLELERAGFRHREIDRALDWLDGLNAAEIPHAETAKGSVRVLRPLRAGTP